MIRASLFLCGTAGRSSKEGTGAGEETRTLDIFVGNEVLYQLSYTRMFTVERAGE